MAITGPQPARNALNAQPTDQLDEESKEESFSTFSQRRPEQLLHVKVESRSAVMNQLLHLPRRSSF